MLLARFALLSIIPRVPHTRLLAPLARRATIFMPPKPTSALSLPTRTFTSPTAVPKQDVTFDELQGLVKDHTLSEKVSICCMFH
ncbi:hypothetical protein BC936DRAFT_148324 [Jimgerdemannia flammicorona]|uniref:Uncharacterized protein n=1 Tax=Jimgerdemannia flammicorona TaxID=994334 RepID=A0A433D3B9_9FUNG|nr:hypothetical protein BC936DRAFT_148324 [Jimgerdemannia flammicorona]